MRLSKFCLFVPSSFMARKHADVYSLAFGYNFVIHRDKLQE